MPYARALTYTLLDIVHVPIWWYSKGLKLEINHLVSTIYDLDYLTGFSVWLKNIFVPMYGQRDWRGRLISILVRLFQIIVRGAVLFVTSSVRLLVTIVYLLLPLALIFGLVNSI